MADYVPLTNLRGPAARITSATAASVSPELPAQVTMTGPDQNRQFAFAIPRGQRGLDGVNGVENDTAVGNYVGTEDSDTRTALDKSFATSVLVTDPRFGAVGDGVTDDTAAIQAAVEFVHVRGGGVVSVPAGAYMVNARTGYTDPNQNVYWDGGGVRMRSNVHLRLDPDATIKAFPSTAIYKVIQIRDCDNVTVSGGTIVGERNEHVGTTGEHGHCIAILGSRHVLIDGVTARDGWGDGIVTTYIESGTDPLITNEDVTLRDVVADNNRRQGLSIIGVTGMLVDNSIFKNTNGALPTAGIDIEPNAGYADVRDVLIRKTQLLDNARAGLNFYGTNIYNIVVEDVKLSGNGHETAQVFGAARANGVTLSRVKTFGSPNAAASLAEFRDLHILGGEFDSDVLLPYANGFRSESCTGTVIDKNRIYGSLRIAKQNGAKITKNHIEPSSTKPCIEFFDLVSCRNVTIEQNTFEGGSIGILPTTAPSDVSVFRNVFNDQRICAMRVTHLHMEVRFNDFHSCTLDVVDGAVIVGKSGNVVQTAEITDNYFYAAPANAANASGNRPKYTFDHDIQVFRSRYQRNTIRPDTGYTTTAFRADLNATNASVFAANGDVPARATAYRPALAEEGQPFFDTTIGKPIWRRGAVWVDSAGTTV